MSVTKSCFGLKFLTPTLVQMLETYVLDQLLKGISYWIKLSPVAIFNSNTITHIQSR